MIDRLTDAKARHERALSSLRQAEAERDALIRTAHREGMTTRAIAEHVGVSHQRVAQIVKPS